MLELLPIFLIGAFTFFFLLFGLLIVLFMFLVGAKNNLYLFQRPFKDVVSRWRFWNKQEEAKLFHYYHFQSWGPFALQGKSAWIFLPEYLTNRLDPKSLEILLEIMQNHVGFIRGIKTIYHFYRYILTLNLYGFLARFKSINRFFGAENYFEWKAKQLKSERLRFFCWTYFPPEKVKESLEMENLSNQCASSIQEYNRL